MQYGNGGLGRNKNSSRNKESGDGARTEQEQNNRKQRLGTEAR